MKLEDDPRFKAMSSEEQTAFKKMLDAEMKHYREVVIPKMKVEEDLNKKHKPKFKKGDHIIFNLKSDLTVVYKIKSIKNNDAYGMKSYVLKGIRIIGGDINTTKTYEAISYSP